MIKRILLGKENKKKEKPVEKEREEGTDFKNEKDEKRKKKPNKEKNFYEHALFQQRLKAWQPIITPRVIITNFLIFGLTFLPLGIIFTVMSKQIVEYVFDYTECINVATSEYSVHNNFEWKKEGDNVCIIKFRLKDMKGPIFLYYQLKKFYQNHRTYSKSYSSEQLMGKALSKKELESDCWPLYSLDTESGDSKIIYPCGLIANSFFTDIYSDITPTEKNPNLGTITFSKKGISWPGDKYKYKQTTYPLSEITPPPLWKEVPSMFVSNGQYTGIPNIQENEDLMVWMQLSATPDFRKLNGRYFGSINSGEYEIRINSYFDVSSFNGTKELVISTTTWFGSNNIMLGILYIIAGSLSFLFGIGFLIAHIFFPRRIGDPAYLSWNKVR